MKALAGKTRALEIVKGLLEISTGEVVLPEKVGGAQKRPPGAWQTPPQPRGSEPRRGVSLKPGGRSEIVKGKQEDPQTPGIGVKRGPSPTTTPLKAEGRPGGAWSKRHRSAGKPAQGIAEIVPPVLGPTQGQEGSGGAPGQLSAGVSKPPSPSEGRSRTITRSSVKREITTEGNLSPESGKTPKNTGRGKETEKVDRKRHRKENLE